MGLEHKTCTKCGVLKPLVAFPAAKGCASGRRGACNACRASNSQRWRAEHPEQVVAANQAWYAKNSEASKKSSKAWTKNNSERARATKEAWRKASPEKTRAYSRRWNKANPEKRREAGRAWEKVNPHKRAAISAKRRARLIQATPIWGNEFFIQEAYHLAQLRTKLTGVEWHVDHIVPLKAELVCGLHNEFNLRVIPQVINLVKGNRTWPDMP